jgi:predicted nuclease of predicted toxin-antitoxin system
MKFLVDECLSAELAHMAKEAGHVESSHVVWQGWSGKKDWQLMAPILGGDWTFVTKNSVDFRGPADSPGLRGHTDLSASMLDWSA